jgi:hypothetical protein
VGVACRFQDEYNHVAAAIRADGMVSVWKRSAGVVERLQDWTLAVQPTGGPGEVRQLQLTCAGNDVRFSVDGIVVATGTDPEPIAGTLAFVVGLLQENAPAASASFDDLSLDRP